jgi:Tol biopolymer transport system component
MHSLVRGLFVVLASTAGACGSVSNGTPDASQVPDTPVSPDAMLRCDPTGAFSTPVQVAGLETHVIATARFSPDELTVYFHEMAAGDSWDLFVAQRATTTAPFGTATPLTNLNTTAGDYDPFVTSDGLTLFFASNRVANEGVHLYVATRSSTLAQFGTPSELAGVNSATVTDNDGQPYLSADGQELWLTSTRAGGLGGTDIYRATLAGSQFANPTDVTELGSPAEDILPVLSADKLTVYLSSTRTGGQGYYDIYTSHRTSTADGFPTPTPVTELNSAAAEIATWLSLDDCRLYYRTEGGTVMLASRTPH